MHMMDQYTTVYYVRFGDGPFEILENKNDGSHKFSHKLKDEIQQAISIQNELFIKAAVLGYPKEEGMKKRVFIEGSKEGSWPDRYVETVKKYSKDKFYHNPIVFHYLSVFKPELLKYFINTYIKPKTKMFIGSCNKQQAEKFYGKIDYYIGTPHKNAYHYIDRWFPEVLKNIHDCDIVLPSAGIASKVIAKRLWMMQKNIHLIDIGSVNNIMDNKNHPAWIKIIGLNKLRKNLGIDNILQTDPHDIIRSSLKIRNNYMRPYVGKRRRQNRAMMYRIFNILGYKTGVEIGVFRGNNALNICKSIPNVKLTCIDPWKKMFSHSNQDMQTYFKETQNKLKNYNVKFIRATGTEAAHQFENDSLDFVHIDAMHDFDSVMTDLMQWVPKVKKGGAISGHDYFFEGSTGVIQAVDAYTRAHNIDNVYLIDNKKNNPSFFWIKE
jgi:predicted O-methyltransferase YrrM